LQLNVTQPTGWFSSFTSQGLPDCEEVVPPYELLPFPTLLPFPFVGVQNIIEEMTSAS